MQPATYHFESGGYKCLAIWDGGHMGFANFLLVNATEVERARALETHNLEADQLASSWTCLLVDTGESTVLIDTGIGTGSSMGGHLFSQMEDAGYPADQIDRVFLTHGHPDHIGGCTDEDGRPIFSRARYLMGRWSTSSGLQRNNWPASPI